jgi:hypothetical protein
VRLVDRQVSDRADHLQEALGSLAGKALRRHVDERIPALADPGRHGRFLVRAQRAVVAGGSDAVFDECVDLVFHQRDEGRDDERHPSARAISHQRRRLEAERLAAAGRQDDDRVAAREDRVHRFALQRSKGGVAPVRGENGLECVHVFGSFRSFRDGR